LQVVALQFQPGPEAGLGPASKPGLLTSGVRPAGSVSVTVISLPSVRASPWLLTVTVSLPA
jgi:hypothetical protein